MRRVVAALVLGATLAGCDSGTVLFRSTTAVRFVTPDRYAAVRLPATLSWKVDGGAVRSLTGADPSTLHAELFIDRAPMSPGAVFSGVSAQDRSGVVDVPQGSYRLTSLPAGSENTRGRHQVTLVLVDAAGRRVSEASDYLLLQVTRP